MSKQVQVKKSEVTLIDVLENPAGRRLVEMLEEYISDGEERFAFEIKLNLHVLSETGRVVVPERLGVAKRFKDWVRHQQLVSNLTGQASVG